MTDQSEFYQVFQKKVEYGKSFSSQQALLSFKCKWSQ